MVSKGYFSEPHAIKKIKTMKVITDKPKGYYSRKCQKMRIEQEMACEYGVPLRREWEFLKFSYIDGAFEKRETSELFTFLIPERIKAKSNSTLLQKALDDITPSMWIEMKDRQKKLRMVSRETTKKSDLFTLEKMLREILEKNNCPTKGISQKRTDIYMDLFDELIRQVAIDYCPEAGQLLVQIRNHYRETLLLQKLIFENSQAYAYRKQIQIKDEREKELKAEIDSILRREKELVDEMRSVERGIILSQERMFYRMVHKAEHYRQEVSYYSVTIMRAFDLLEACLPPEFKDSLGEVREKELEKKREDLKKDEQRKRLEGEDESDKSGENEEAEEEEEEVKTRGMKALEDLVYRSEDEEVFEETTSEDIDDDEFSETPSAPTPIAGLDMTAEKIAFQRFKAQDSIKTITLAEMDKGEVLAHKKPTVIIDIPVELEKKEEVKVQKFEDDEEPEEETEDDKERARRRKLQSMGLDQLDDEGKEKLKQEKEEQERLELEEKERAITEEEERKAREEALEEEEEITKYSLASEEEQVEEEGESEEVVGVEEWHPGMLAEGLDEEGEAELEEEMEIVTSSSPSVSEEEEQTRKDPGKKKQKPKSTIIVTKDLIDVEMGETDTSDFEEEEDGEGSHAS